MKNTTLIIALFEKPIGIHGFGNIAQKMIPLLQPFGGTISTYSPSVPDVFLAEHGVQRAHSLEALFSENEVIVELAPYHAKNHHIVTEELLRSIPKGGCSSILGVGRSWMKRLSYGSLVIGWMTYSWDWMFMKKNLYRRNLPSEVCPMWLCFLTSQARPKTAVVIAAHKLSKTLLVWLRGRRSPMS